MPKFILGPGERCPHHSKCSAGDLTYHAGFFLMHYSHLWRTHLERLYNLYSDQKLKVALDPKPFLGVKSVADAVEYLHSGQSLGKVVVRIDPSFGQGIARL